MNNKRANYDAEKGLFVGLTFDRWPKKLNKGKKPLTVRILSRSLTLSPSLQLKPLKLMRRRKTLQPMLISQMMILKRMKKLKNLKKMKRKKTMKRQPKIWMKMVWGMLRMMIWSNRNKGQLIYAYC